MRSRSAAARRRPSTRSRTPTPPPGSARSSSCSGPRRCGAGSARSGAPRCPAGTAGSPGPPARSIQNTGPAVTPKMPSTALVWFRRDLRVHDHPPLRAALDAFERVVPAFVLDDRLLDGRHASPSRTRFMLESLADLRESLRRRGGDLVDPPRRARARAARAGRGARRDRGLLRLGREPVRDGPRPARRGGAARGVVEPRRTPGNFVADIGRPKPYTVFTPFWRAWKELRAPRDPRRAAQRSRPGGPHDRPAAGARRHRPGPDGGRRDRGPQAHARLAARRDRRLRRAPRPGRRRDLDAQPLPALRLHLRARARAQSRPARRLHAPARVARLLCPCPPAQPGQRPPRPPLRARRDRVGGPRRALRRLARGPHRLSDRRRGHARAQRPRAGCTTAPG